MFGSSFSSLSRGIGNIQTSQDEPSYQKIVVQSDMFDYAQARQRYRYSRQVSRRDSSKPGEGIPKTYVTRKGALIIYANTILKNPEPPKRQISILLDSMDLANSQDADGNQQGGDPFSLGSLTRDILAYGSKDPEKICMTVPNVERRVKRVRAGFSAKRYLASLVDHVDEKVGHNLIEKGLVRSIYQNSMFSTNIKRRVNADISSEPEPYTVMKILMNIPGTELTNFLFIAEKSRSTENGDELGSLKGKKIRAGGNESRKKVTGATDSAASPVAPAVQQGAAAQAPADSVATQPTQAQPGSKIRVFETVQGPDGNPSTVPIEYRQLERDKKVQVLANLLVKTAITYAVNKKEKRDGQDGEPAKAAVTPSDQPVSATPLPLPDRSAMFIKMGRVRSMARPVPAKSAHAAKKMKQSEMAEALASLLKEDEQRVADFSEFANGTTANENTPNASTQRSARQADGDGSEKRLGSPDYDEELLQIPVDETESDLETLVEADEPPPPQPFSVTVSTKPPSPAFSAVTNRPALLVHVPHARDSSARSPAPTPTPSLAVTPAHSHAADRDRDRVDASAKATKAKRLQPAPPAADHEAVSLAVPGSSFKSLPGRPTASARRQSTTPAVVVEDIPGENPSPLLFGVLPGARLGGSHGSNLRPVASGKVSLAAKNDLAVGTAPLLSVGPVSNALSSTQLSVPASRRPPARAVPATPEDEPEPEPESEPEQDLQSATDEMDGSFRDSALDALNQPDIANLNPEEYELYQKLIEQARKVASVILQNEGAGEDLAIDSETAMQAILIREMERNAQEEENEEKKRMLKEVICDIVSTKTGNELNPDEVNISNRVMERLLTDPELQASDLRLIYDGRSASITITTDEDLVTHTPQPDAEEIGEHLPSLDAGVVNLVTLSAADAAAGQQTGRATQRRRSGLAATYEVAAISSAIAQLKTPVKIHEAGWVAVEVSSGVTAIVPDPEPPAEADPTSPMKAALSRASAAVSVTASPSKALEAEQPEDLLDKLIKEQQSGKPTPQKKTGQAPTTKSEVIRRKSPPPSIGKKKQPSPAALQKPSPPKPPAKTPPKNQVVKKKVAGKAKDKSAAKTASPEKRPEVPPTVQEEPNEEGSRMPSPEFVRVRDGNEEDAVPAFDEAENEDTSENQSPKRQNYSIDDIRRTLGQRAAPRPQTPTEDNDGGTPLNAVDREARAARRKAEAEQRRLLMEQRRKEKEEAKKREEEERERQARMQREIMDDQQRRIEMLRAQREAAEAEKRKREMEEEEAEMAKKRKEEFERQQKDAYQRKLEEMQRKLMEEEERKRMEEEERKREEELRKLEEQKRMRMLSEAQRREYERKLAEEAERKRLAEEQARLEREAAMKKAIEEARRLALELARQQMEEAERAEYIRKNVVEREGLAQHAHRINRSFVTSYFELLQWLQDL